VILLTDLVHLVCGRRRMNQQAALIVPRQLVSRRVSSMNGSPFTYDLVITTKQTAKTPVAKTA